MPVKDWMSENVITLEEDAPVIKALQIMKEYGIRRIPITKDKKLVGIVTDRDIKSAVPSKAFALDEYEICYILSGLKMKDVMTKDPIIVSPDDTVEYAVVLMLENKISGLPVVDENGFLVGIITQTDVLKLFVNLTGIYHSPYQIGLIIKHPDELSDLFDMLKKFEVYPYSVLVWKEEDIFFTEEDKDNLVSDHKRMVFIRFKKLSKERLKSVVSELNTKFKVLYVKKEDVSEIPRKNA